MIYKPEFYADDKRIQLVVEYTVQMIIGEEWLDETKEQGLSMLLWYAQNHIDRDYEEADWLWSKMEEAQQVHRYAWGSNLRYYTHAVQNTCESIIEQWRPE